MAESCGTLSEDESSRGADRATMLHGLVVAWSADEADRVGEIAPIPGGSPGPLRVFGRGGPSESDADGRLMFAQMRGADVRVRPPFNGPHLSRTQLRIRELDDCEIEVENVGRLRLRHNGVNADKVVARSGDTLQLGAKLLFLVVRRSFPRPGASSCAVPDFPFGTADTHGIVGESPAAWELRDRIAFIGPRAGHVLVTGASGAGKELVARAMHASSARGGRPLCSRNASTIPEGIVDAELFGNARNYPNAGVPGRGGLIGASDGTSLFLDEFGELPVSAQAHFLRVLDAGEYQRLGEASVRRSDFRLIAATNRPTAALKEDVLARLPLRVDVPGLNARREDIPLLARHILRRMLDSDPALSRRGSRAGAEVRATELSLELVRQLVSRTYSTHARELEALLWQAVEHSQDSGSVGPVPASVATVPAPAETAAERSPPTGPPAPPEAAPEGGPSLVQIQRCLDAHNGVIESSWRPLGLASRHVLTRLIRKHRLEIRKRAGR
jgi:DNA-binding NtrC family response regulator